MYYADQNKWQQMAAVLRPTLFERTVKPSAVVEPYYDENAWQKTSIRQLDISADEFCCRSEFGEWNCSFDFGEHLTGYLEIAVEADRPNDSPVRIAIKFAETPYELFKDFRDYQGNRARSWLQEELLFFDVVPEGVIRLPRRYAFRYVNIFSGAPNYKLRLKSIAAIAVTSADEQAVTPLAPEVPEDLRSIDQVATVTLRECMQYVFEDGPKRDQRLWVGDLWMEAKSNSMTFRNHALVERCMYLFAAAADEKGSIPGAVFDREKPLRSSEVVTYSLLFAAVLRDHLNFYPQRRDFCRELLPAAERQLEIVRQTLDENNIITIQPGKWYFIDHNPALDVEMAAQGIYIYSLQALAELREKLNLPADKYHQQIAVLRRSVRQQRMDENSLIFSGSSRQLSYAAWAWQTLAGTYTPQEAAQAWHLLNKLDQKTVLLPCTPYLWSTVLEALYSCGETAEAEKILRDYWGGMVRHGADTFWEHYEPDNEFAAPCGDCLGHSACHAWSCMPNYFIRRNFAEEL